jgi:low affinity Fe/Cu permease
MIGKVQMLHSHSERLSNRFSKFFASPGALYFGIAVAACWVLSWFGDRRWHDFLVELVALVSFLTIFVFQRSQSKDVKAIQIKLDELIASSDVASNRMIKAEEAPEHVLDQVHEIYKDAAKAAMDDDSRSVVNTAHADKLMEALHEDLIEAQSIGKELETMSHDQPAP